MTDPYIRLHDPYSFQQIDGTNHDLDIPKPLTFGVFSAKDIQARECVRMFVKCHMKAKIWSLGTSPQNPWAFWDIFPDEDRFARWWVEHTSNAPGNAQTPTLFPILAGDVLIGVAFVATSERGDCLDMSVSPLPLMDHLRSRVIAAVAKWIFHHPHLHVVKARIRAPLNSSAALHAMHAGFGTTDVVQDVRHAILTKYVE